MAIMMTDTLFKLRENEELANHDFGFSKGLLFLIKSPDLRLQIL